MGTLGAFSCKSGFAEVPASSGQIQTTIVSINNLQILLTYEMIRILRLIRFQRYFPLNIYAS